MRSVADCLLAASIACLLAFSARAHDGGSVRLLVQSSPLAGFRFHDAAQVGRN